MNIKICSYDVIEKMASNRFGADTALISIGDTGSDMPKMKHKPAYMLRLEFDDISSDERDDYRNQKYTFFDEEKAVKIAKFISAHRKNIKTLICQCEHGQSRSAAVAAAVCEFYFGKGTAIFADDRYYPNKLVFRLTLKALIENNDCEGTAEL